MISSLACPQLAARKSTKLANLSSAIDSVNIKCILSQPCLWLISAIDTAAKFAGED